VGGGKRQSEVNGVRWYEIRTPNTTPVVFQHGTFSPDSNTLWMGSMTMDKVGDITVGYSVFSTLIHPAIRFAVRTPGDPAGTLEPETGGRTIIGIHPASPVGEVTYEWKNR
jgi:hypothetical protein